MAPTRAHLCRGQLLVIVEEQVQCSWTPRRGGGGHRSRPARAAAALLLWASSATAAAANGLGPPASALQLAPAIDDASERVGGGARRVESGGRGE